MPCVFSAVARIQNKTGSCTYLLVDQADAQGIAVPSACVDFAVAVAAACLLLQQIIDVNNGLRHGLEKGLPIASLMENWDFLQVRTATGCLLLLLGCQPGEFLCCRGRDGVACVGHTAEAFTADGWVVCVALKQAFATARHQRLVA
jgi:hypothetical protein